jgi:hypothetical protein
VWSRRGDCASRGVHVVLYRVVRFCLFYFIFYIFIRQGQHGGGRSTWARTRTARQAPRARVGKANGGEGKTATEVQRGEKLLANSRQTMNAAACKMNWSRTGLASLMLPLCCCCRCTTSCWWSLPARARPEGAKKSKTCDVVAPEGRPGGPPRRAAPEGRPGGHEEVEGRRGRHRDRDRRVGRGGR